MREAPVAEGSWASEGGGGRVVVVGAGPGGLFAALSAALSGARVTLIERGDPIETRGRKVVAFHRGAEPDPETNLLFGDGGAGTYSDGKLYTRTSDRLEPAILQELAGRRAAEIAFDARAHIGTDRLHRMLPCFARLRRAASDSSTAPGSSGSMPSTVQRAGGSEPFVRPRASWGWMRSCW